MKGIKWIIVLAGAIVTVLLLRGFLFTSYIIPSSGMENVLFQGDRIIVNKWSYGLRVPCMSLLSYHRWRSCPVKTGDIAVFNNPGAITEPVIDKKDVFIGRCIAVPGDTLVLNSYLTPVASLKKAGPDRKQLYRYPIEKEKTLDSLLTRLAIDHNPLTGRNEYEHVRNFSRYEMYLLEQALPDIHWLQALGDDSEEHLRTIIVPAKGKTIEINRWNAMLYRNTLILHEGIKADIKNDSLYINGKPTTQYTFAKDYYWMASNNSVGFSDSRLFGFVPHDHIIGKAVFIWFSKEAYTGLFNGYRWDRFFRQAK